MTTAIYPCLKNKPILISGGASGIGEAIVRSFGSQGARVGFVDLLEEAGAALAGELKRAGQVVDFQACDITDTDQYRRAIKRCEELHGPCLVLINNAANDTGMTGGRSRRRSSVAALPSIWRTASSPSRRSPPA